MTGFSRLAEQDMKDVYIENVKEIFVSIYAISEKMNVVRRQDLH